MPLGLNKKVTSGAVLLIKQVLPMSQKRGGSCGLVMKGRRALFPLPGQPGSGRDHLVEKIAPWRGLVGRERKQTEEFRFDINSCWELSLRALETKGKVSSRENYWTQKPLSKSVGTSFVGGLEDTIPTCSPPQRQEDGQVTLWMDREKTGQVWLTLGSGVPIHMHSFSFLCPGEDSSDLIRHFLIESSAKGVHLKGADEEPYFGKPLLQPPAPGWAWPSRAGRVGWEGLLTTAACFFAGSLSAFVCQHSIMALALPCKLTIPKKGGSGPQGGNIRPLGLFVLTRKARSGHISPDLWIVLVS